MSIRFLNFQTQEKFMKRVLWNFQTEYAEKEEDVINYLKPEFDRICYNSVRAAIIHLLVKAKGLNYSLSVEHISRKLGKRHSVVIHHLEKLMEWGIVDVVKTYNYGDREKRSIWGLNLKYPNLIFSLYNYMTRMLYTVNELEEMCNVNMNVRQMS